MRFQTALAFSLMIFSTLAVADCTEKDAQISQMRTTIDQLTLRIAELVKENDRLEEATLSALASVREGKKVVVGCDTGEYLKTMAYSNWNHVKSADWIKANASKCTDNQIRELQERLSGRSSWFSNSRSVLNFELEN